MFICWQQQQKQKWEILAKRTMHQNAAAQYVCEYDCVYLHF